MKNNIYKNHFNSNKYRNLSDIMTKSLAECRCYDYWEKQFTIIFRDLKMNWSCVGNMSNIQGGVSRRWFDLFLGDRPPDQVNEEIDALKLDIARLSRTVAQVTAQQIIPENLLLRDCLVSGQAGIQFIEVLPTDICNHRCSWCFTAMSRSKFSLSSELAFNRLSDFVANGGQSVLFSGGGEPLLWRSLVEPDNMFGNQTVVSWLSTAGVSSSLITNGVYLQEFVENNSQSLSSMGFIRVSLDACDSQSYMMLHGTKKEDFDRVIRAIENLIALRDDAPTPAIGLSFVVDEESDRNTGDGDMQKISSLVKQLGIDFVQFKHLNTNYGAVADEEMLRLKDVSEAYEWGAAELWIHRYKNPRPRSTCAIPMVSQALGASGHWHACCHTQHVALQQGSAVGFSGALIQDCDSQTCRYVNLNDLVLKLQNTQHERLLALCRLKSSLLTHGFHPYRFFPSSPELVEILPRREIT